MDLVPIGEAARRLGVNPSALRFYEERGLIRPAARVGGRRMYDADQLRRLAFIQTMRQLGIGLEAAAAMLEQPAAVWRKEFDGCIADLDALIARARGAREFLRHAQECPADHPLAECPYIMDTMDRRVAGVSFDELAAEHGFAMPPS